MSYLNNHILFIYTITIDPLTWGNLNKWKRTNESYAMVCLKKTFLIIFFYHHWEFKQEFLCEHNNFFNLLYPNLFTLFKFENNNFLMYIKSKKTTFYYVGNLTHLLNMTRVKIWPSVLFIRETQFLIANFYTISE